MALCSLCRAQYINLLRELKLNVKLREAHEKMAAKFPLTDQLWQEWVEDELGAVRTQPRSHTHA